MNSHAARSPERRHARAPAIDRSTASAATSAEAATAIGSHIQANAAAMTAATAFATAALGVNFYEPVDVYQRNYRALHYAALLIVITFLAFFLFEQLSGLAVHAMQYLMVGLGLALFYLLLLALSEHLSFVLAYAISAAGLVLLITVYLTGVFRRVAPALAAGSGFR